MTAPDGTAGVPVPEPSAEAVEDLRTWIAKSEQIRRPGGSPEFHEGKVLALRAVRGWLNEHGHRFDAPAIHAAGVAQGREEARREYEDRCDCRFECGDTDTGERDDG